MEVRIGITTSLNEGEQRLDHAYVRAVEAAGGMPYIVPMLTSRSRLAAFAAQLHGLVVTGGPAVTDGLIGELPDDIDPTDPVRIRADSAIVDAVIKSRGPILGICYGMQLLNALEGGTLYADVEAAYPGALVHSAKRGADIHAIDVEDDTVLHRLLGQARVDVNTRHIQALATVAPGFRVAARAPDGVVEAIENEDGTIVGVQFHPERMGESMLPLFRHLVERARSRAAGTTG